jgi:hypothetical protein
VNRGARYFQYRILLSLVPPSTVPNGIPPEVSALSLTSASFAYGDANLDGSVDVSDAITILRIVTGQETSTPQQVQAGDVAPKPGTDGKPFGDGALDVADVVRILRAIVGQETLP